MALPEMSVSGLVKAIDASRIKWNRIKRNYGIPRTEYGKEFVATENDFAAIWENEIMVFCGFCLQSQELLCRENNHENNLLREGMCTVCPLAKKLGTECYLHDKWIEFKYLLQLAVMHSPQAFRSKMCEMCDWMLSLFDEIEDSEVPS